MRLIIGVVALVLGVMLLVWGHQSAEAINSEVTNLFTGHPTNRTMYFYAGGAALAIYGALQVAFAAKQK